MIEVGPKIKYLSMVRRDLRTFQVCMERLRTYPPKTTEIWGTISDIVPVKIRYQVTIQCKLEGLI